MNSNLDLEQIDLARRRVLSALVELTESKDCYYPQSSILGKMPLNHSYAGTMGSEYGRLDNDDIDDLLQDYVTTGLVERAKRAGTKKAGKLKLYKANQERRKEIDEIIAKGLSNLTVKLANHKV